MYVSGVVQGVLYFHSIMNDLFVVELVLYSLGAFFFLRGQNFIDKVTFPFPRCWDVDEKGRAASRRAIICAERAEGTRVTSSSAGGRRDTSSASSAEVRVV